MKVFGWKKVAMLIAVAAMLAGLFQCSGGINGPRSGNGSEVRIARQNDYDSSGRLRSYWLYTYSASGDIEGVADYDSSDTKRSYSTYEVAPNGVLLKNSIFNFDGSAMGRTIYKYSPGFELASDTTYDTLNRVQSFKVYEFVNGRKTGSKGYFSGGQMSSRKIFEYGSDGLRTKTIDSGIGGAPSAYTLYKYKGGLLDSCIFYSAQDRVTEVRKFFMEKIRSSHDFMAYGEW